MTARMHVFHLIKSLGRGGAEVLLAETFRHTDPQRVRLSFGYFLPWKVDVANELKDMGAEVTCFGARSGLSVLLASRHVSAHVARIRPDVIHCHLPLAGVAGRFAGLRTRTPVVYTEHNTLERYHPLTRRLSLMSWNYQEKVIAVSSGVASSIARNAGNRVPVEVLPNGIDVEKFRIDASGAAEARQRLGIPQNAHVIGTVAVFRAQKRLLDWLRAAQIVARAWPDARFLLVGDGPLRAEIERQVESLGLQGCVLMPGLATDVRPYLAAMDVFVISSEFEGLPLALLEAMAMERAVVATRVGGIPEVVRSGCTGLLVEPRDPPALAHAIHQLLESPQEARSLAAAGRRLIEDAFSIPGFVRKHETIYAGVIDAPRMERKSIG